MVNTNLILIRHAEKLHWPLGAEPTDAMKAEYVDNHLLSAKGMERSHALVSYFNFRQEMLDIYWNFPLTTVLAQDIDIQGKGKSQRPLDTIWPLLQYVPTTPRPEIQYPLQLYTFTKKQVQAMVDEILAGKYHNQTVLISWNHEQLPEIVHQLGVDGPSKWPKGRYDVTWVVEMKTNSFQSYNQRLCYGDMP